ncbi:hypothetical protein [Streptacidiphilus sp. EB103A]|uniref:hypothetical protein n=1 Tax=Streptacidiphilus sp. EB103A TaxID=3156275 RepID=UPI0035162AAC
MDASDIRDGLLQGNGTDADAREHMAQLTLSAVRAEVCGLHEVMARSVRLLERGRAYYAMWELRHCLAQWSAERMALYPPRRPAPDGSTPEQRIAWLREGSEAVTAEIRELRAISAEGAQLLADGREDEVLQLLRQGGARPLPGC